MENKKISVGGQALIEGVMMRSDKKISIAVRKNDGDLVFKDQKIKPNKIISKIPILRGVVALIASMVVGIKALTFSAEYFAEEDDDYERSKFDEWVYDKFGDKAEDILVVFSMIMALGLAVLLFAVTPTVLINFLKGLTSHQLILSAFEGITKILIFVVYLYSISRMRDIKRVFQYHGAEHKSIFTYENDEELTVENAKKYPTLHPRCGTNFLAIVLMVSILLFSFLSWESILVRVGLKLLLLPLVAGISYEVLKLAGKSDSKILKVVSYPGLMMQKITTSEPDEKQLEVALAALKRALADDEDQ